MAADPPFSPNPPRISGANAPCNITLTYNISLIKEEEGHEEIVTNKEIKNVDYHFVVTGDGMKIKGAGIDNFRDYPNFL